MRIFNSFQNVSWADWLPDLPTLPSHLAETGFPSGRLLGFDGVEFLSPRLPTVWTHDGDYERYLTEIFQKNFNFEVMADAFKMPLLVSAGVFATITVAMVAVECGNRFLLPAIDKWWARRSLIHEGNLLVEKLEAGAEKLQKITPTLQATANGAYTVFGDHLSVADRTNLYAALQDMGRFLEAWRSFCRLQQANGQAHDYDDFAEMAELQSWFRRVDDVEAQMDLPIRTLREIDVLLRPKLDVLQGERGDRASKKGKPVLTLHHGEGPRSQSRRSQ